MQEQRGNGFWTQNENLQFIYWSQHKLACKADVGHERETSPS